MISLARARTGLNEQNEANPERRQILVLKLMELPNHSWTQIILQANQNTSILWEMKTIKAVALVMRTNARVAQSLGAGYIVQLVRLLITRSISVH